MSQAILGGISSKADLSRCLGSEWSHTDPVVCNLTIRGKIGRHVNFVANRTWRLDFLHHHRGHTLVVCDLSLLLTLRPLILCTKSPTTLPRNIILPNQLSARPLTPTTNMDSLTRNSNLSPCSWLSPPNRSRMSPLSSTRTHSSRSPGRTSSCMNT